MSHIRLIVVWASFVRPLLRHRPHTQHNTHTLSNLIYVLIYFVSSISIWIRMRKIVTAHKTLLHRTTREYIHKHTFIYVAAYHTYQKQQTKKRYPKRTQRYWIWSGQLKEIMNWIKDVWPIACNAAVTTMTSHWRSDIDIRLQMSTVIAQQESRGVTFGENTTWNMMVSHWAMIDSCWKTTAFGINHRWNLWIKSSYWIGAAAAKRGVSKAFDMTRISRAMT